MSAMSATIQALLASPAVTGIVAQRIHPDSVPQNSALPHILVYGVSEAVSYQLQGDSGMQHARVTVEVRAATATQKEALARAAINALKNREGTFAGVSATFFKTSSDFSDFNDNSTTPVYRRMVDFMVHWT